MTFRRSDNPELSILWLHNPASALTRVIKALDECNGDLKAAAASLRISRTTLHRWVQKHRAIRISLERIRDEALYAKG